MDGELPTIFNVTTSGKAKHYILPIGKAVGGLFNGVKAIANFDIPWRENLEKSFLDIGILHSPSDAIRLKVWMDGISLSKEFKPNYSIKVSEKQFSTILLDVLPIVKRENARPRSRVVIINTGPSPFVITHASLFTILKGGSEKSITYATGGIGISSNEIKEFRIQEGPWNKVTFSAMLYAQDPPHTIEMLTDGKVVKVIDLLKKAEDLEFATSTQDIKRLGLRRAKDLMGRKKAPTILTSVSITSSKEEDREMEIEARVKNSGNEELYVQYTVRNLSNRAMRKVSIVGFASGNAVYREHIGDLPEGKEAMREAVVKLPKEARTFVLRLIWNDGAEVKFLEKRYKERENQ